MLTAVSICSLIAAALCIIYGFIALRKESGAEKELKQAITNTSKAASAAAQTLATADSNDPATAKENLGIAGGVLKELSSLAEALSKLKQGVAALVLALAFVIFAGVAAGVEAKVESPSSTSTSTATSPSSSTPAPSKTPPG